MTFGSQVRYWRLHQHMSQRELAKKADISNAEISRIENDRHPNPSAKTVIKLCIAFDFSDPSILLLPIIKKTRITS